MHASDVNIPKGMRITSGSVTLEKKKDNLIGISIGGGSPLCPCLYVVQIFDNSTAASDGTLEAGDELLAVNGISLKNYSRSETAKLIQESKTQVVINYNKLHVDAMQGKCCEISLKKMKHKLVEKLNSSVADVIGLSRAILVNDSMVKRFEDLKETARTYKYLIKHLSKFIHANLEMATVHKMFGDICAEIGIRESQVSANEAFCHFGKIHRTMEKNMINSLKNLKQVVLNLQQFALKAIPDMQLTIKKYLDVKFEYLAYCLKVKEMDDEEYSSYVTHEALFRIESGNYEYRLFLRCRQESRKNFADARTNVLIKLELLDNKYVQDITSNLQTLIQCMSEYHRENFHLLDNIRIFPIEIDIANTTFAHELVKEDQLCDSENDSLSSNDENNTLISTIEMNSPLVDEEKQCVEEAVAENDSNNAFETDALLPK